MQFRNRLLASLSPADAAAFSPFLTEVALAPGQTLYEAGDEVAWVYFPTNAVLSVVTLMQDGRAVEAATIGNESAVGVVASLAGLPVHTRIFAQIGGEAWRFPASRLRAMAAESPSLLKLLLSHVHKDMAQAEQAVACNAIHSGAERLAKWLLLSQDRAGTPVVRLTQEYLAVMLGVQRTTVSALANTLKTRRVIKVGRGRVEIVDRRGLEAVSCECYGAVSHAAVEHQWRGDGRERRGLRA